MSRVEKIQQEINESITLLKMNLRISGRSETLVQKKLTELSQNVLNMNDNLAKIKERMQTLSETNNKSKKSDETAILLKKLKEAYEVKFRDLELGNQVVNQEIQDLRKEAENLTVQLDQRAQARSRDMKVLEDLQNKNIEMEDQIAELSFVKEEAKKTTLITPPASNFQKEIQEFQKRVQSLEENINRRQEDNNRELKQKDSQIEMLQRKLNLKEKEAQFYRDS